MGPANLTGEFLISGMRARMSDLKNRGTQRGDMARRVARHAGVLAAALCAPLVFPCAAGAVAATPAWHLAVTAQPTNFVPGATDPQGFLVIATNLGAADTSGNVTLGDTLPSGLLPEEQPEGCEKLGPSITCVIEEAVHPGESVVRFLPVSVGAAAGVTLEDVVTVRGGGAGDAEASIETEVGAAPPDFDFLSGPSGLEGVLSRPDGTPATRAGSTPYELTADLAFPTEAVESGLSNVAHPRDVAVDLPAGISLDPAAVPRCRQAQLEREGCPPSSQIGLVGIATNLGLPTFTFENVALYNVVPPPGSASDFGFILASGLKIDLLGSVRAGDYGLAAQAADLLAQHPILSMLMQFWGDPSDPSHDAVRGAAVEALSRPLMTLPSACGPLELGARTDSWENPGLFVSRSVPIQGLGGESLEVEGCSGLAFAPTLSVRPTTAAADSPVGLQLRVGVPQQVDPGGSTTSSLRRATVSLPSGLVVNPAAATGLAVCSPAQVGLLSEVGEPNVRFDGAAATCPDASKLGTVEATTPLLQDESDGGAPHAHPLKGSIYLAQPDRNPFGSLFALYAVIEDPETGIVVKLAAEVVADPATGRLTASFGEMPQLPLEELKLDFFEGPRAPLRTPALCGSYPSRGAMSPWSGTAPFTAESSFTIATSPSGGTCADAPDQLPDSPRFLAGTVSPAAGRYSPFILNLSRSDGSQELGGLDLTLPAGLVGSLAGSADCPDAALVAAKAKSGGEEEVSPSCPAVSRLGRVLVDLGAGSSPYTTEGKVYLAGPYRGAPLSLAIVTPAAAGPFDLGTVVVRAAVSVDPTTGQVSVRSDPLPSMLDGVPLDVRSLRLELDKPDLIRNPTSCEPMTITGSATSITGQVAPLSSRFQVGDCEVLAFRPKVSLSLSGPAHRGAHPGVHVTVRTRSGDANLSEATVSLPPTELLDTRGVKAVCPAARFVGGHCPQGALVGHAEVWTPLLDLPLEGDIYLRSSPRRLPVLAVRLKGQVEAASVAQIDSVHGRLRLRLKAIPDVPLAKAVLDLYGGKRGLIVDNGAICAGRRRANVVLEGQNGRMETLRPRVASRCASARQRGH
jgi:hypothetical protein